METRCQQSRFDVKLINLSFTTIDHDLIFDFPLLTFR